MVGKLSFDGSKKNNADRVWTISKEKENKPGKHPKPGLEKGATAKMTIAAGS